MTIIWGGGEGGWGVRWALAIPRGTLDSCQNLKGHMKWEIGRQAVCIWDIGHHCLRSQWLFLERNRSAPKLLSKRVLDEEGQIDWQILSFHCKRQRRLIGIRFFSRTTPNVKIKNRNYFCLTLGPEDSSLRFWLLGRSICHAMKKSWEWDGFR